MRTAILGCFILIPSHLIATDWYIMVADTTPNSGVYGTSIALDSLGNPHIAYCRYNGPGLMYTSWNPEDSTWIIEYVFDSAGVKSEIDGSKIAGGDPSLAFDSNGYPHISFWWGDLGYAWKDSLGWHTTHPNPGPWIDGTSLVLDRNDYAHIGYSVEINDETALVLHTYRDEYGWHSEIVDTIFWSFLHNVSFAIDKNDCIHIAYGFPRPEYPGSVVAGRGIMYGKRDEDGVWHTEKIIDSSDVLVECEGYPSIVLDSLERPCIAYASWDTVNNKITRIGRLKYTMKMDSIWVIELADTSTGGRNSLSFDQFGNPHICYQVERWLRYAWRLNGIWHTERIDSTCGIAGQATYPGLAIDDDDYAHISYNKELTMNWGNLKYATGYPEMGMEIEPELPLCASLNVYPSIGKQSVKIEFTLNRKVIANLSIYNITGQKVIGLVSGVKDRGKHTTYWDTKDKQSRDVPAGVYFITFKGEEFRISRKVVVLR